MDEVDIGRTLLLWFWALGLAGIEIEIEGGYGWAERMPTWYRKRALPYRIFGVFMGGRPLTGYHVFAFTIPLLLLHLPFVAGVDWTLEDELIAIAVYFVLASVWDYLWFVLNPAYTVRRFMRGRVWWFEVPWIWRFPLDYYVSIGLSVGAGRLGHLAGRRRGAAPPSSLAACRARGPHRARRPRRPALPPLVPAHAPRRRRRPGCDEHHPPPAPEAAWAGGVPELAPLAGDGETPRESQVHEER